MDVRVQEGAVKELAWNPRVRGTFFSHSVARRYDLVNYEEKSMGRYLLLWLLGVPIPILLLIWFFGGLH